jgi:16S rRNA (cytidine1402-2'-O)-methyltransferase
MKSMKEAGHGQGEGTGRPAGEKGVLYVVSTPIGNLEDITLRAIRVLREVRLIAAENVSHTKVLCGQYGIRTRLTPYHQHNQRVKGPALIEALHGGQDIALVTDAGTPGISDPGAWLVRRAAEEGLAVSPVPGASALAAALSVSGLPTQAFLFAGFLPQAGGKRKKALRLLASYTGTLVFYEAPHRIREMLQDVVEILGDRETVLARELTKLYEEVLRGRATAVLARLVPEKVKGEFTVVVGGPGKVAVAGKGAEELLKEIRGGARAGALSTRDLALKIAADSGLPFRRVYRECIAEERKGR